ncbi:hypothetical protein Sjap_023721 [Stephania japonica]|uniref:Uncharacterized protein n=1 Tax=Stephania japonica TaxID=461633 RepID=A0AAP0EC72_9MAGN
MFSNKRDQALEGWLVDKLKNFVPHQFIKEIDKASKEKLRKFPLPMIISDLEPSYPRPKTSVRTAQRLIAQGMGQKIPKSPFGSNLLRKQDEARRKRITTRQALRVEAWDAD